MNDADNSETELLPSLQTVVALQASALASLKPKGACWYCNAPLDNIRRFCNKTCAQDYQTEEEAFR